MVYVVLVAGATASKPGGLMGKADRLMTVPEVADHLAVAVKTVHQNWRSWGLKGIRVGGGESGPLRFRAADIETLEARWEVQ